MTKMYEIKIYLDREKKIEASGVITFEKVLAGDTSRKSIFIENVINYPINMEIKLEGENVNIVKNIEEIRPGDVKEVEFEFTPKITIMKPITANLKIKINYIIR